MTNILTNAAFLFFIGSSLTGVPFLSLVAFAFASGATMSALHDHLRG